jgi:uncharacterized protein YgbK (DUF1537 family)
VTQFSVDPSSPPGVAVGISELRILAPEPLVIADARRHIRESNAAARTRVIFLDDDPTGSQSVQGVPVLTRWTPDDLRWAFSQPSSGFFILTNTRGLNNVEAAITMSEVAAVIDTVAAELHVDYSLVARSDSTLRGHYPLETDVLLEMARNDGRPYNALLIAPAYIAAGRVTASDVHYVQDGESYVPVGKTSYARDATFGFQSSDIRDYVEEKTEGLIPAGDVVSLSLEDIRTGGPERVRDILLTCTGAIPVIVNALDDSDLDVVTLGLLLAEEAGSRVLCRTGPSFVASRLGMIGRDPLSHGEIFAGGERIGNGLVVVGSHVELTSKQVTRLSESLPEIEIIELEVPRLLDPHHAAEEIDRCGVALAAALQHTDVLLVSSRLQIVGDSGHSSLVIAQSVSKALVDLVRRVVRDVPLKWVLAKGGITSSDIATDGLGIRRAIVAGQLFDGIVSVWLNDGAGEASLQGLPYVVFAGNVGDETTLADAVSILRGSSPIRE